MSRQSNWAKGKCVTLQFVTCNTRVKLVKILTKILLFYLKSGRTQILGACF